MHSTNSVSILTCTNNVTCSQYLYQILWNFSIWLLHNMQIQTQHHRHEETGSLRFRGHTPGKVSSPHWYLQLTLIRFHGQCCILCFEGLLPEPHDNTILKLLYLASYWHSLAKLWLHTETTLKVLDNVMVLFARALRHFKEVTCPCFSTVETNHEYNMRCRAAEWRTSRSQPANNVQVTGKRAKTFNLLTLKLHMLGDYIEMIKMFGITDSYSTQIVHYRELVLW